jgi:hypothetical protein
MNVHYKMFQVSSMAFTGASARRSLHLLNPPFHYCDPSRVLTWHSSTDFISRLLRGCFYLLKITYSVSYSITALKTQISDDPC